MKVSRRGFISRSMQAALGAGLAVSTGCETPRIPTADDLVLKDGELFFDISLAEWSLHRTIWSGELEHLDFPSFAKKEFGISTVEYVSQFFGDKVEDDSYLSEMKTRAEDVGVRGILIMVDFAGNIVSKVDAEREAAIENHYPWIDAATKLGCHSIRVNLPGKGTAEEIAGLAINSLSQLAEFAAPKGINVLVEPHGGYSSSGAWLVDVMTKIGMDNCGTLPDFGNFRMSLFPPKSYDRYQGVEELMPFAKGVSAKTHEFDSDGNEKRTDFARMIQIIKKANFAGHIGIEYEGSQLSEYNGILATKALLIKSAKST